MQHERYRQSRGARHKGLADPDVGRGLFCGVLTVSGSRAAQQAVIDSWCRRCDACVLFSNATRSTPADAEIEQLPGALLVNLRSPGDGKSREHLADKARRLQLWVANHASGFAWYLNADDDTYVCVDNLVSYLMAQSPPHASERAARPSKALSSGGAPKPLSDKLLTSTDTERPLFLGHRFLIGGKGPAFHSGGAGFVLSAAAHRAVASGYSNGTCGSLGVPRRGPGDTEVAECLMTVGVNVEDTRDDGGRERFHPFDYHYMLGLSATPRWWYHEYTTGFKPGIHGMANATVSYHYVPWRAMAGYEAHCHPRQGLTSQRAN